MDKFYLPGGGYIKPAEPTDNPGELQAAMMPRKDSFADGRPQGKGYKQIFCPVCDDVCYANADMLREAAEVYPDRMVPICTRCALISHQSKGALSKWLIKEGLTPNQVLGGVLLAAAGGPP